MSTSPPNVQVDNSYDKSGCIDISGAGRSGGSIAHKSATVTVTATFSD